MLLGSKTAIIYGGGGAIGSAAARADWASTMTATEVNLTGGAVVD